MSFAFHCTILWTLARLRLARRRLRPYKARRLREASSLTAMRANETRFDDRRINNRGNRC